MFKFEFPKIVKRKKEEKPISETLTEKPEEEKFENIKSQNTSGKESSLENKTTDKEVEKESEVSPQKKERMEKMLNNLIKKDDKKSFKIFENIINILSNWKQEDQQPIIREILDKKIMDHGIEGKGLLYLHKKELFFLMRDWSFEKSEPLVKKELDKEIQKKICTEFLSSKQNSDFTRAYEDIAPAISNWPEQEIERIEQALKNKIETRDGLENSDMKKFSEVKFRILKNRVAPITDKTTDWLKKNLKYSPENITPVLKKYPELFKKLAPDILLLNSFDSKYPKLIKDTLEKIQNINAQDRIEIIQELLILENKDNYDGGENGFRILKSEESISDPEIINQILESFKKDNEIAENLIPKIEKNKEIETAIKNAAEDKIAIKLTNLNRNSIKEIIDISKKYNLGSLSEYENKLPIYAQSVIKNWNLDNIEQVTDFFNENYKYVSYLSKNPDQSCSLTPEDLPEIPKLHLKSLLEAEQIKSKGLNLSEIKTEEDYQKMFEALKETNENWQDEENISELFENGAKTFGYEKMFKFIDRENLSRHNGLYAFEKIIELYKSSGLMSKDFYSQILYQVKKDDSEYEEGTAHHNLNAIVSSLNTDFSSAHEIVKKYPDIPELQELTDVLSKPENIFSSWSDLKRYSELTQFLEQTEILDELEKLAKTGNKDLYNYIKTLAFHKYSKVDMKAVMQFWRDPYEFFSESASYAPEEIHNSKKPSNYVEIPNLDLYADELRDALVEGKIDGIQAFSGLEIKYQIPIEDESEIEKEDIRDLIKKSLGSRKENITGTAKNSKKLFSNLKELFKEQKLNLQKYLDGENLPEEKAKDLKQQIENLIYDSKFGIKKTKTKSQSFIAKIQLKSNPEGALAGNDTVNCMPFGDGKNTVYTFNPNTALFTIQMKGDKNTNRTIAQSVLTKDKDIDISIPEVIEKMNSADADLSEIIPQNVVMKDKSYIACDNVEVAPRYSDERYQKIIENIYRDFFQEYIKRFAKEQNFHSDKAVIGMGYTDALTNLPQEKNTFAPLAPVSYSDKIGEQIYVLDLLKKAQEGKFLKRNVVINEPKRKFENPKLPDVSGIEYLTFQDALPVAFLESKAYKDNQSLIQNLHNMENGLIAKDINNAAKNRPNMSFKYTDSNGQIRGYVFAYEGKLGENENEEYNYDENIEKYQEGLNNQRVLYISDLASDKEQKGTGLNLLKEFFESYKQNYTDKNDLIPIYFEAREKTSYQFIQKGLPNLLKKLKVKDIDFEIQEFSAYKEGKDTMHPMIIKPVKK